MTNKEIDTVDVTGELLDANEVEDLAPNKAADIVAKAPPTTTPASRNIGVRYTLIPFLLLTVALLGGLRLAGTDSSFIFLKPALLCLILASIMLALFFRSGLLRLNGWLSEDFPLLKNAANIAVLLALFAATTQIFNSLLPEQG